MNLNIQDAFGILSQQEAKAITADVLCFGLVPACNTDGAKNRANIQVL